MTEKSHASRATAKVAAAVRLRGPITVFDLADLTRLSEGWVRSQLDWLTGHRLVAVTDAWPHVYRWEPQRPPVTAVTGLLRVAEATVAVTPCEGTSSLVDDLRERVRRR